MGNSSLLVTLIVAAAAALAEAQSPIAPVRIAPPAGNGAAITIALTGVEQDPVPIVGRWNAGDACLADVACFAASWIEANSAANLDHLLALRAANERATTEKRLREPQLLSRNASRFSAVKKWGLLGWAEYGTFRIVFLTREDEQSQSAIYTLPIARDGTRWVQTDALAADAGVYEIFDRIGKAILERHRK